MMQEVATNALLDCESLCNIVHGEQIVFRLRRNMGTTDRVMRILVGVTLLVTGPLTDLAATDMLSNVLLSSVATVALLSAAFSYCFLYDIAGFDTCGKQE